MSVPALHVQVVLPVVKVGESNRVCPETFVLVFPPKPFTAVPVPIVAVMRPPVPTAVLAT